MILNFPSKTWIWCWIGVCYLYFFPYYPRLNNPNENVRIYLTRAIVDHGVLHVEDVQREWGWVNDKAAFHGHLYSAKAPGASFVGVPIYATHKFLARHLGVPFSREAIVWTLRVFGMIVPTLLFLFFFHRFLRVQFSQTPIFADLALLICALASLSFSYSMIFSGHQLSAIALFSCFMLVVDPEPPISGRAIWAGAWCAAVPLLEMPIALGSAVLAAVALFRWWVKPFAKFLLGMAPVAAVLMTYNYLCFGSPFTSGNAHLENRFDQHLFDAGFMGISWPKLQVLATHMFSSNHGMFFISPVQTFSLLGLFCIWRTGLDKWKAAGICVIAVALWGFMAGLDPAIGGWVVGPRYITALAPFNAYLTAVAGLWLFKRAPQITLVLLGAATTVGIVFTVLCSTVYPHFPPEFANPVFDFIWPLLKSGHAAPSLGSALGLSRGWAFIAFLGIFSAGLFYWNWTLAKVGGRPWRTLALVCLTSVLGIWLLSLPGRDPALKTHNPVLEFTLQFWNDSRGP